MTNDFDERDRQIRKLQQNLSAIRKIAGWTAETLGNKIGVTKQTISNLENQKSSMNFTQYIAIRAVIDSEIEKNQENEVLHKVVALLLDSEDRLDEDDYSKVQEVVGTVAASAAGGTPTAKLDALFNVLIKSMPIVIPIIGAIIGSSTNWMKKLLK
ncbi:MULTISPECIES: helix-turn-helix transcriptional regulator [unclassified Enterococcus]|uniref:helix-turn-helix transcriptional regulator n=1 Tax=unclassified Enterococcus TaxID=2608891 RepID=UPI0024753790|nr:MULTISPECIES: helix-turn-helix transcriptional regulator [unclassified Enterococcus]